MKLSFAVVVGAVLVTFLAALAQAVPIAFVENDYPRAVDTEVYNFERAFEDPEIAVVRDIGADLRTDDFAAKRHEAGEVILTGEDRPVARNPHISVSTY